MLAETLQAGPGPGDRGGQRGRSAGRSWGVRGGQTRHAHPNARFAFAEPRTAFHGRGSRIAAELELQAQQLRFLQETIGAATGLDPADVAADMQASRILTADQAQPAGAGARDRPAAAARSGLRRRWPAAAEWPAAAIGCGGGVARGGGGLGGAAARGGS